MKVIDRQIYSFQEKDFFIPIRDKIEYTRVLVLGARQLLLNQGTEGKQTNSHMKLIIDKMSRLFFFKDKKYFSIAFPFTAIIEDKEVIELSSYSGKRLDNMIISSIISILDSDEFRKNHSLMDCSNEPNSLEIIALPILEEIFMFEPSYIRYDIDLTNEKGSIHPLYHLDINYSQYSTFKLGLNKSISEKFFENLQNTKNDCCFLRD